MESSNTYQWSSDPNVDSVVAEGVRAWPPQMLKCMEGLCRVAKFMG